MLVNGADDKPIENPEYKKIMRTVGSLKLISHSEETGQKVFENPTLAKAVVMNKHNELYLVDRNGDAQVINPKTNQLIRKEHIDIHTNNNGIHYFEFEGKKYHADPNH